MVLAVIYARKNRGVCEKNTFFWEYWYNNHTTREFYNFLVSVCHRIKQLFVQPFVSSGICAD